MRDSLCWRCANSGAGGCSWDVEFEPVPGWTARPTRIRVATDNYIDSYHVEACPEYRPIDLRGRNFDGPSGGRPKFTDEQFVRLIRGGFSPRDIANLLHVHINTVYSRKLRLDAKRRAKENGTN